MIELTHYIDAFSSLHTAKLKGHKAPHKAVLLLAIIDFIEEGVIRSQRIVLSDSLEKRFHEIWHHYLGNSSIFISDISKPFFHMQHEPFWRLVEYEEVQETMVAEDLPFMKAKKEKKNLPSGSYSVSALRRTFAYAEIDGMLYELLRNVDARAMLRVVLINEYLTGQPTKTMPDWGQLMAMLPIIALVA
ncbi:hypothetical protein [Prevotella sp.]|uniref:hypothetical protein n=1 Tax=uncultured Prevotella sp. TaxID=159272 RepID=UPI0025E6DF20|nr:hypothetical protein [Prevotella sp.]MCI7370930.1 hypothetical protein [Prevotella sp.]